MELDKPRATKVSTTIAMVPVKRKASLNNATAMSGIAAPIANDPADPTLA